MVKHVGRTAQIIHSTPAIRFPFDRSRNSWISDQVCIINTL